MGNRRNEFSIDKFALNHGNLCCWEIDKELLVDREIFLSNLANRVTGFFSFDMRTWYFLDSKSTRGPKIRVLGVT